jgi:ribosomal protein S7
MPRRREIPKREAGGRSALQQHAGHEVHQHGDGDGKKSTAERILYQSFDIIKERTATIR